MASRTPRRFSASAQYSGRVLASGAVPTAYETLQEGLRGLPPFGLSRVLTEWTLDPFLFVGTVWVTGLYLWGVWTLHERGDRWPAGRTAAFLGGMACFVVATQSGLAAYDTALLSVHMVQHMVLAMVVPVFLALGAPVTLALRTLPRTPRGAAARGAALAGGEGAHVPAADVHAVRRVAVGALLLRVVRGVAALAVRARADARAPGARRLAVLLAAARGGPAAGARRAIRSGC